MHKKGFSYARMLSLRNALQRYKNNLPMDNFLCKKVYEMH